MCMGWRGFVCWPIRKRRRHPPRSSATSSSPSTKQEGPTLDLESISPRQRPAATTEEVPALKLEHVSTPQSMPPALPPPTGQGAPTLVPEFLSTPTLPPTTTTTTNQEDPVPAPNPDAVSTGPPPAKPTFKKSVATTVGNGLIVGLGLLQNAVTGISVPGLEGAVNGLVGIIELVKDVRGNVDDLGDLDRLLSNLAKAMETASNLHQKAEVDGLLRSRIDGFLSGLREMMEQVREMLGEGVVARTANSQAHKDAIQDIKAGLNFLLNQFTAQGTLSLELNMAGARHDIRLLAQAQAALALAREYEDLIKAIPRAGARYNDTSTKPSRPCHPGTRKELLEIIVKWIVEDPDAKPYFWLCGEVGVGKTTVAHTIAIEQQASNRLGACFFFSRHDESRRNPHLLFTSIAYQLARFDQDFYNALARALKPDPDIVKRTPTEQFKQLVLEPLMQSGIDSSRTVVIVIDGLDECSDPASILDVLAQGIDEVGVRLRVLISSRPYSTILTKFKATRLYHLTSETQFRDIRPTILNNDIVAYLSWELGAIASRWQLVSPWPPQAQLDQLIRRAGGLMIVASTYAKYIEDPMEGDPKSQLARILSMEECVGASPLTELDTLYNQVLIDLKSTLATGSQLEAARDIIAFVILAPNSIDVSALAGILRVNPSYVRSVLRRLTAVILLPGNDDDSIAPFHASFGEYIQDSTCCTVHEFSIDGEATYDRIAGRCSDVIVSAAKDGIIGVEYDSAKGASWYPKHWIHIAENLPFYMSHSSPAQAGALKTIFVGTCSWTLSNMMLAGRDLESISTLIEATGLSENLSLRQGSSESENIISYLLSLIYNHTLAINQMSDDASTTREPILVDASTKLSRRQAFRLLIADDNRIEDDNDCIGAATFLIRNVRCWMKCTHSNIMSFSAIDIKYNEKNVPQEALLFISSPLNMQHSFSLHRYLNKGTNFDGVARARIALGIADGLCCLHGSFPPQPHNGINPHQIMVSGDGQPILYPSTWDLDFQSRPPPTEKDDVDEITCRTHWDFSPPGWYHWNPTARDNWQRSLEARLQVDIWDFGSILYQMIAGEEPLTTYNRLVEGNEELEYEPPTGDNDLSFNDIWDEFRYEAAVPLLLNSLQASEDIKALLKSCWTIRPQDRPPMSEVFERLKAAVKDIETGKFGV